MVSTNVNTVVILLSDKGSMVAALLEIYKLPIKSIRNNIMLHSIYNVLYL